MRSLPLNKFILYPFIIIALTFAAYSVSLRDTFKTMDDEVSIVHNENIRHFSDTGRLFTSSFFGKGSYYRPMVSFTHMLEYHLFGLNPFYYYLTNIFIHIAAALVLLGLLRIILRRDFLSFMATLLFAIHPVQWEAVSNVSGRPILLSAFCTLAAFYFFLRRKKGDGILSLLFFSAGLLSKESAGVFPLILLAARFCYPSPDGRGRAARVKPVVPFFIVDIGYVLFRRHLGVTHLFAWPSVREALLGFTSFLRGLITYGRLLVWPVDLHFDRAQKIFVSFAQGEAVFTIIFFVLLLGALAVSAKRLSRAAVFFLLWTAIEFLPVSQIFFSIGAQPGYISLAEHFLYLPVIGIFTLAALSVDAGIRQLRRSRPRLVSPKVFVILIAGIYAFFFLTTIQQNIYAAHEISMFERTLRENPANARIRNSLAFAYAKYGRLDEAEENLRTVLKSDPFNVMARIGLGKVLADRGEYWESLAEYEKIRAAGVLNDLLRENYRLTMEALTQRLEQTLRRNPRDPQVLYSLGVALAKQQRMGEAVARFEAAVSIRPDYKEALFNLASILEAMGNGDRAVFYYKRMLGLPGPKDQMDRHALHHAARILQGSGGEAEAEEFLERAEALSKIQPGPEKGP